MTTDELAKKLKVAYDSAPNRAKHVAVVLFGIEFSEHLKTQSISAICAASGIGKWGPQVSLGVNLAEHVHRKK